MVSLALRRNETSLAGAVPVEDRRTEHPLHRLAHVRKQRPGRGRDRTQRHHVEPLLLHELRHRENGLRVAFQARGRPAIQEVDVLTHLTLAHAESI